MEQKRVRWSSGSQKHDRIKHSSAVVLRQIGNQYLVRHDSGFVQFVGCGLVTEG